MTTHSSIKHWDGFCDLIDDLVSEKRLDPSVAAQILRELRHCHQVDEVERMKILRTAQLALAL